MKTILCYGDSNTWGFVPGKMDMETMYMERYPRDVRWSGRLQQLLGNSYHVVEAGLNGRTTNVDYAEMPGRNGLTYLLPCLYSAAPVDLVVLMIGANDLKVEFNRKPEKIAEGISELITLIQQTKYGVDMQSPPEVLLVGYPVATDNDAFEGIFFDAVERSKSLNKLCADVAAKHSCHYFDAAPYVELSEIDGIHLDEEGHEILADKIAEEVVKIQSVR